MSTDTPPAQPQRAMTAMTMPLWPDAALLLGVGRSTAYSLARRGEFPVRLLRVGTKYRVSRADLLTYLGESLTI
jgi:excisionase family DNA binding protein